MSQKEMTYAKLIRHAECMKKSAAMLLQCEQTDFIRILRENNIKEAERAREKAERLAVKNSCGDQVKSMWPHLIVRAFVTPQEESDN